ncbi:MAG TPA: cyanophycin synthetase [Rhabdochlamydiaceae bacterium]|jgi:dihydrofolate synthase/folylpolyglutamate synthase
MNYNDCIQRLFAASSSIKMHKDLGVIQLLDKALGFPSQRLRAIHIAGSNGKGSVAIKIACALEKEGYKVGLYTSPHIFTFRERIAINSQWISEEEVADGLASIFSLEKALGIQASFFELATALAFDYFCKQKVDVAVIETGLGGRWDATNILLPMCCAITSISREHAHILGDDLEIIAGEKAGIIKENTPVILGPMARFPSIHNRAKLLNAPVHLSHKISQFFDEENSAIAQLALQHLPFSVSAHAIEQGLALRPPCRLERSGEVIFDVAHNPDAIFHLLQALHIFFPKRQLRFVAGFSADKDYELCLQLLADVASHIHLVRASTSRAASLASLAAAMEKWKAPLYTAHEEVFEAVQEAHTSALERGELLVITGSFYIMADAKAALGFHPVRDRYALNDMMLLCDAVPSIGN